MTPNEPDALPELDALPKVLRDFITPMGIPPAEVRIPGALADEMAVEILRMQRELTRLRNERGRASLLP